MMDELDGGRGLNNNKASSATIPTAPANEGRQGTKAGMISDLGFPS
jgi:hypothetical protein